MEREKKYEYIRLEQADNGLILRYEESYKPENKKGVYDDCCHKTVELVYSEDKFEEAFAKMKSLYEHNKKNKEHHTVMMPLKGLSMSSY
jgi:hypothetical protein